MFDAGAGSSKNDFDTLLNSFIGLCWNIDSIITLLTYRPSLYIEVIQDA